MTNAYTCHALTRHGFDSDIYVYADTAAEASKLVRQEFGGELVSVSIRKTVYGESDCFQTVGGACINH